jgi:uncharacterized membrane protein
MSKLKQAVIVWIIALLIATAGLAILYYFPDREALEDNFIFWSLKTLFAFGPIFFAWQKTQKIYSAK